MEYLVCEFGPSPFSVIHLRIIHQLSQCTCKTRREKGTKVQSGAQPMTQKILSRKKTKNNARTHTRERLKRSVHAQHRGSPSGGLTSVRSVCEESWLILTARHQSQLQCINKYMHSTQTSLRSTIGKHKVVCKSTCKKKLETCVRGTAGGL